jgi:hypothetical protein
MDKLIKIIEQIIEVKIEKPKNTTDVLNNVLKVDDNGDSLFDFIYYFDTLEEFNNGYDLENDFSEDHQILIKDYYRTFKPGSIKAFKVREGDGFENEDISKYKYCAHYGTGEERIMIIFHNVPGVI